MYIICEMIKNRYHWKAHYANKTSIRVITQLKFIYIESQNKIYREKSIPMTTLWCPSFSNHG